MSRQASGLKAWVVQRVTAVYLGLFATYLALVFVVLPPADHAALLTWVRAPLVLLGLLLFIPVLLAHAWVGIRDVYMDYLPAIGARVIALALTAFILLGAGLWAMQAIILAQLH